jgi:hypothetical protein
MSCTPMMSSQITWAMHYGCSKKMYSYSTQGMPAVILPYAGQQPGDTTAVQEVGDCKAATPGHSK